MCVCTVDPNSVYVYGYIGEAKESLIDLLLLKNDHNHPNTHLDDPNNPNNPLLISSELVVTERQR